MMPPDWVLFIVASTFLIGALFFCCTVPSFIKLKYYRIFSGKAEREENTVAVKCTLWSALSSMVWIYFFLLLSVIALDFWLSPLKINVKIVLSGWPIYLSSLFCLSFWLVLLGHQAVFDDYGMTVKKNIWGKPIVVPWNRVKAVDYNFLRDMGGSGFHFSYLREKDTREDFVQIYFGQKNYIKGLEYAAKRISQNKFDESARKKLKKMGISLSSQIIAAPTPSATHTAIRKINAETFPDRANLTSVTIPVSVESIGLRAFDGCSRLASINVAEDNAQYSSVDGVLFNKDKTVLIQYPEGKLGAYIVIPNSVVKIEEDAFSDCAGLFSVEISNNVTEIGENAFSDCTGLTVVTIPDSVALIGDYAFSGCESLTLVRIPSNVTSIGKGAFWCGGLKSIRVAADNANYSGSSDGILFNKTQDTLIQYPAGKSGAYTIPDGVTKIEALAFADCAGLTCVEIPNSVTEIEEYAFSGCKSLKSVTLPPNVKSVKPNTFKGCVGLASVVVQKRAIPPKASADAFGGITLKNVRLYVPANSVAAYRRAKVWKEFNCVKAGY